MNTLQKIFLGLTGFFIGCLFLLVGLVIWDVEIYNPGFTDKLFFSSALLVILFFGAFCITSFIKNRKQ